MCKQNLSVAVSYSYFFSGRKLQRLKKKRKKIFIETPLLNTTPKLNSRDFRAELPTGVAGRVRDQC